MELNDKHIAQIAMATTDAAQAKARELVGEGWFVYALAGVILASDAAERFINLLELLGPDAMSELAKVVNTANEHEVVRQAEKILGGNDVCE